MKIVLTGTLMVALIAAGTESEAASEPVDTALGCVETTISAFHAPTGESMAAGGSIGFRDDIAPHNGAGATRITAVYIPPDSYYAGKAGDRVRVCLITVPKKSDGCDPSKDVRGRNFIIYDRNLATAMLFSNGEHDCGGA